MSRLCDALAAPPYYVLPPATVGHTRHYMPQGESKNLKPITALTLDSFVRMDRPERTSAWVIWQDASLDHDLMRVLDTVVIQIPYLGRAESWCRISVEANVPQDDRLVRVVLAERAAEGSTIVQRLAPAPETRGLYLWRSLCEATVEMRKARRRMPEGSVYVDYVFPPHFGFAPSPWSQPTLDTPCSPRTERFLLEAVQPRGVLPAITETVRVGNLMRLAAMKMFSRIHSNHPAPTVFTGRVDGAPATGHVHAYFLPRDLDNDGRIDHLDVRLPIGAYPNALNALLSTEVLYAEKTGRQAVTSLGSTPTPQGTHWRSITPFVAPRHPGRAEGRDPLRLRAWIADEVRAELQNHGFTEPADVAVWEDRPPTVVHNGGRRTRFDTFVQGHRGPPEHRPVFGVDVRFLKPVRGPIAIGREAHFGFGQLDLIS
jgi:CRISPR-associated protein Csb2